MPSPDPSLNQSRPRFPIPSTVEPTGTRCIQLIVPDDREHLEIMWGALMQLTRWNNWQLDGTDSAARASTVWREILAPQDINSECVMIQFRQPDLCTLEVSLDGGDTWSLIYDANACVINGANDLIAGYLADGTLSGGQPPPSTAPTPPDCDVFQVTLDADGFWRCPVPIAANFNIKVENVSGMTNDGAFLGTWRCGDGGEAPLGVCTGSTATNGSDPMPSQPHMRLIMKYNSTYYDAYNVDHDVSPSLVGQHQLEFQVNDTPLDDNSGQLRFQLTVCNFPASTLQYDDQDDMDVVITQLETLKWHVVVNAQPSLPFAQYQAYLWYGTPAPGGIQMCARYLITNASGWLDDSETNEFTSGYDDCDDHEAHYASHSNPFTVLNNICTEYIYLRSYTQMTFDVEVVFDCP